MVAWLCADHDQLEIFVQGREEVLLLAARRWQGTKGREVALSVLHQVGGENST